MSQFAGKQRSWQTATTTTEAVQRAPGKTTLVEQAYVAAAPHASPVQPVQPVQMKGGGDSADVHAQAEAGAAGPGGPLPFLDRIQQSFGRHDVSGVRAHTDEAAAGANAAIGAQAYARGNDVAFGGAPDLHTAAHEAAHVVQQRAGVHLKGGVGEHGDAYERHADAVADTVVAGGSAEALLSTMAGAPAGGRAPASPVQPKLQLQPAPPQPAPDPTAAAPKPLTEAEILTKLTAGAPLDEAAIRVVLDCLRKLTPLKDEKLAETDAIAKAINVATSPLVGDARWRAWNLRVYGPEAQWPPYLRGDTALAILAARKKIEAGGTPEEVANALRPLNPTALHQVITVWRSDLPKTWFTAPMTPGTYLDLVMAASGGPSFAPAKTDPEQAPVIDPALHSRSQDEQYDYLKTVYDARGFTFKETGSEPDSPIEINVLNIRFYDMTVKGIANPKLTVNDYNGRLFVVYKDAGGKKVQSWVWSTTGPGKDKQSNTRKAEQKLLKGDKFPTSAKDGKDAKIDPARAKEIAKDKDGVQLANEAYTDWQFAVGDAGSAKSRADLAMTLSDARANADPGAAGAESTTKTTAREAGKLALDAAQYIDTSVTEAKRAKTLFGKKRPDEARDPDEILKNDEALGKEVQATLDRAGHAFALASFQEKSSAEETARLAWEKALKDKGETAGNETSAETKAAWAAYKKAREANNQSYGEANPGKMSETNAIAWLQEGQYVARYNGMKLGKQHWSVNAEMHGEASASGIVPVNRDYNADGVIDPGEKDLPGTAVGTGVLIHVGDKVGWSIGCQVAPASDFDQFVTLVNKLGAKSSFRYGLIEAPHLPAFGGGAAPAAAPAGGGNPAAPKDAK